MGYKYLKLNLPEDCASGVFVGHNGKVILHLDENFNPTSNSDSNEYYFKYNGEKETTFNIQKPIASAFCSFLSNKYGGNLVTDIPCDVEFSSTHRARETYTKKGVLSESYKNNPQIYQSFSLDSVLKPRGNEDFSYTNKERVFQSVENSMNRLNSYMDMIISNEKQSSNKTSTDNIQTVNYKNAIQEYVNYVNLKNPNENVKIDTEINDLKNFILNKVQKEVSPYCMLNHLDEDLKAIESALTNIVYIDYLFLNNDRHSENIEFIIYLDDNNEWHIGVSSVFDNDRTFGLDQKEQSIINNCSSTAKREAYVDCIADVKFVIYDEDTKNEICAKRGFTNNYQSDRIAQYVYSQCTDEKGVFSPELLETNPTYMLYSNYKNINIYHEFISFLYQLIVNNESLYTTIKQDGTKIIDRNSMKADESELTGILNKVYSSTETDEDIQRLLDIYNRTTDSNLKRIHITELTENFNIRQKLLNQSFEMQKRKVTETQMNK